MSRVRESVVAYLQGATYEAYPSVIAARTGMKAPSVRRELQNLLRSGVVVRNESRYRMAEPKPVVAEIGDPVMEDPSVW